MFAGPQQDEVHEDLQGDPRWVLLENIASSQHLKASARLRDFLFYIGECAIRNTPENATEQQIGIRVFGRHPGYNSSEDSIVRTHARLLRQKIAAYSLQEGLFDELIVEIPKGHYLPVFHERTKTSNEPSPSVDPLQEVAKDPIDGQPVPESGIGRFARSKGMVTATGVLLLACLAGFFFWPSWKPNSPAQRIFEKFWHPFLAEDPPWVIYSNALFIGNSANGLKYASPQAASGGPEFVNLVDTYTGIGELSSVYILTRLFDAHQSTFTLKRSLLATWDEAKYRNLIFIGASSENPSLRVLQPTLDFTMQADATSAGIVNHHPKNGEPALYSRPEHPLNTDYAIVALVPGMQSGKHILIFSGLTTFGTQAAVEYLCRPESAAELLRQVTGPKGDIRPFEAVLQTAIGGGVALQTRLVTIRVH